MRLAVVSPFLDRRHGTERCIIEQLERFAAHFDDEIHLYSQRVEDLAGVARYPDASKSARILWHKVPGIGGPHLFAYLWWFFANQAQRWWDSCIRRQKFDLLYSPGINALDADAIAVHIVFHELYLQVRAQLRFRAAPLESWPRLFHRHLYYQLMILLERRIYRRRASSLAGVSGLTASRLAKHFQRTDVMVIRNGVDTGRFSPGLRQARRTSVRDQFSLSPGDFCILLIGNDWKTKGLDTLLSALARCRELPLKLLVVGTDDRDAYEPTIRACDIADRVCFLDPSPDVLQFYAAADVYVGPSLDDAFGLPILEAMACGMPVIASCRAGVSEIITNGKDGMILQDAQNSQGLAGMLRTLHANPELCRQMGEGACKTAQQQTWDRNAAEAWEFLQEAAAKKNRSKA
ncbi:MAG: glycosyltransferase family 4 protein [Candidatus Acidiferrales bacterium]